MILTGNDFLGLPRAALWEIHGFLGWISRGSVWCIAGSQTANVSSNENGKISDLESDSAAVL